MPKKTPILIDRNIWDECERALVLALAGLEALVRKGARLTDDDAWHSQRRKDLAS